jgi:hypothetical protein
MVEKLTFNSLATALVDLSAIIMPITRSLKTFRVDFYCPQHLCNDHAV